MQFLADSPNLPKPTMAQRSFPLDPYYSPLRFPAGRLVIWCGMGYLANLQQLRILR